MENNHIILESAYNGNAKFYLYLIFAVIFLPLVATFPQILISNSFGQDTSLGSTIWISVIAIIALIAFAIIIFPLKKGLYKGNSDLFIGYFTWGKLIFKQKLSLNKAKAVSILKFKRRERGAFLSVANPEFSTAFSSFEVYALNEKHTQRKILISLRKEINAKRALEFVKRNTALKEEIYSPDFS